MFEARTPRTLVVGVCQFTPYVGLDPLMEKLEETRELASGERPMCLCQQNAYAL